jgi:Transposase DDE domain
MAMRGDDEQTGALFSHVSCEARVPSDHPLRLIRAVVDEALDVLSPEFDRLYARVGRQRRVTPHVAVDGRVSKLGLRRGSGIDGRTLRRPGYAASQRVRKRIEAVFGWIKSSARLRQTEHRGRERVGWRFDLAATAYNLIRLPKLLATAPT